MLCSTKLLRAPTPQSESRARTARSQKPCSTSLSQSETDEEAVDQKKYFEESCKPNFVKSLLDYQACVKRIEGDDSGHKHCTGQYFDYWSCVDKCVAPKLFPKLK